MGKAITAEIYLPGDPSVGIDHDFITINLGRFDNYNFLNEYDGGRESFRQGLKEWAETWFEKPGYVLFGDECPDCGKIKTPEQPCNNQNCISNHPNGDS